MYFKPKLLNYSYLFKDSLYYVNWAFSKTISELLAESLRRIFFLKCLAHLKFSLDTRI